MGELWEWAADFALFGDIGKHDDETIAAAVEWEGDPQILIDALVDTGWVDRTNNKSRLVLHDWRDGCEAWVSKRISRFIAAANGSQRRPPDAAGGLVREGKGGEGKNKGEPRPPTDAELYSLPHPSCQ